MVIGIMLVKWLNLAKFYVQGSNGNDIEGGWQTSPNEHDTAQHLLYAF